MGHVGSFRLSTLPHAYLLTERAFGNSLDHRYSSCQCRLFACIWSFLVTWWCQIAHHASNRRPIDPRGAILGEMLDILTQAPTTIDPGNCARNDPAARLHLTADLVGWARHNRDRDTQYLCRPCAITAPRELGQPRHSSRLDTVLASRSMLAAPHPDLGWLRRGRPPSAECLPSRRRVAVCVHQPVCRHHSRAHRRRPQS